MIAQQFRRSWAVEQQGQAAECLMPAANNTLLWFSWREQHERRDPEICGPATGTQPNQSNSAGHNSLPSLW